MTDADISVLICDDHKILTDALAAVIESEPGMRLVADPVHNAEDAVALSKTLLPDVVLMDIDLNGPVNGVAATRDITTISPRIRVIVVSGHRQPTVLVEAVEAGASGFLNKGSDVAEVLSGIRSVARGGTLIDPRELARLLPTLAAQRQGSLDSQARLDRLTVRERQILQLLVEGHRNEVIAERLFISTATARTHISNILSKLGVHSQLEAVALAARNLSADPSRGAAH